MSGEPEDWKEIEFGQALSRFAGNLLRIMAGELTRLVETTKALADQKGWRKVDDVIAEELRLEPQWPTHELQRARFGVVQDALRLAAARVAGSANLASRSGGDLENSIRRYNEALEVWARRAS
jgi:hypothetical protein